MFKHISRRAVVTAGAGLAALGAGSTGSTQTATPGGSPAASNAIQWPEGQALPSFAPVADLAVIPAANLLPDELSLFVSLQGLVNRERPRMYIDELRDEGRETWLRDGLGATFSVIDDPWALLEQFADVVNGIVVVDDAVSHTLNVASTMSGLRDLLVASPRLVDSLIAEPYGFKIVEDLRGRFSSNLEANTWQVESLWPHATHRVLYGLDPEGVFGQIRDHAIAMGGMPFWLDGNVPEERELLERILKDVDPDTPYLGWFDNDVAGEFSGTQFTSEHAVYVLAADWFCNMTVWSGTPRQGVVTAPMPLPPPLENKLYVTIVVSEGDNLQYNQHRLRLLWDDPGRGSIPLSWTTSPLLADCAPAMLAHFASTATENDHLMCGPSGAGYMNPDPWPDDALDTYMERTRRYMDATGMSTLYVLNRNNGINVPLEGGVAESFESIVAPLGIALGWESQTSSTILPEGTPVSVVHDSGDAASLANAISDELERWDGVSPGFVAIGALAWNVTPTTIAAAIESISNDNLVVLRGDHYFTLMREAAAGGATPIASPSGMGGTVQQTGI